MGGFVYGLGQPRPQHTGLELADISMAAPYYGYGLCYNTGVQNIEGVPRQFGSFNGLGVGGKVSSQPVQMHYCREPCGGHNNRSGSATRMQVGSNPYDKNGGTQTIQGDMVQRGNFNGRGIGVRIPGHYSVSGDIN